MARYMTLARFKVLSVMPGPDIDLIESFEPGWILAQIDTIGGWVDSRLAKRYATPFGAPPVTAPLRTDVPAIIEEWLAALLTPRCYAKRGVNPSSGELWFTEMVIEPMKRAMSDIKEAADAQGGLFDLPLKGSTDPNGAATRSGPKGYSETSPYVWTDVQRNSAYNDDTSGEGSTT